MATQTLSSSAPSSAADRRGALGRVLAFLRANPMFTSGVVLLLGLYLFGAIGSAQIDWKQANMGAVPLNQAPSEKYPLGTDGLGRDMLAVMLISIPNTMKIGLLAGTVGVLIGTLIGLFAGYYRGIADAVFSSF